MKCESHYNVVVVLPLNSHQSTDQLLRYLELVTKQTNAYKRSILYYIMLCYVMLCYVMLCYVMLCYVMLCYVKLR